MLTHPRLGFTLWPLLASAFLGPFGSPPPADASPLGLQGDFTLDSRYTSQSAAVWGRPSHPWDFNSNSRISLDCGGTRLSLSISKPLGFRSETDPSRYITLELGSPWYSVRYGDLSPNFTAATTGFTRVSGLESRLTLKRGLVEVNSVRGSSQRAAPGSAFTAGGYRRFLTGHHLKLSPFRSAAMGLTVLRLKDDLTSMPGLAENTRPVYAKDDLVLGTDMTLYFMRRRASVTLEYVASIYSSDVSAPSTDGTIEADSEVLGALTRNRLVRQFTTVNDSTEAGHMVFGRLVMPVARTRSTFEYRRTSPSFTSLATPYDPSDSERFRLTNTAQIIPSVLTMTFNGDYGRSNLSGTQPFGTESMNLSLNMTASSTTKGRLTTALRQNESRSDAPTSGAIGVLNQRLDRRTRSFSLSGSRPLVAKGVPFTASGMLTASRSDNKTRAASGATTYSVQLGGETLPDSRVIVGSQTNFSRMRLDAGGVTRSDARIWLKGGYEIKPKALELYGSGGVSRAFSSHRFGETQELLWGGGGKWVPRTGREIEVQWQSSETRDLVSSQRRRDHSVGVRFNYSFASTRSG